MMESFPLSAIGAVLGALVLAHLVVMAMASRKPSEPPAGTRKVHRIPSTLPVLGNTWDLVRMLPRIHDFTVDNCLLFQGEPVATRALGQPDMVTVSTPAAVEDVLKTHFDKFPKGSYFCDNVHDLLGDGIFGVDGDKWVHQRKTANHLFTMRALRDSMTSSIWSHAVELRRIFDRAASDGAPLDLFKLFNRFTMEAFAEIGFGVRLGALAANVEHPFQTAFDEAQRVLALRFTRPMWFWKTQRWLNVGAEGELRRHIHVIDSTVFGIINESLARRSAAHGGVEADVEQRQRDIVSLFLDNMHSVPGVDAEQQRVDPTYLRDIVVNFLIAGRDTTAQALSWFFLCLSANPAVEATIVSEIRSKTPRVASGEDTTPTMEQASELVYLEAALKETLRLYPSVPFVNKKATEDVVLSDGTLIAAQSIVGVPMYAMGRMPYVWGPDAAEFKPERWLDPATGKLVNASPFKFVAFNAGPRTCLGMNLALLEMKLVVSSLLARFRVALEHPAAVRYDFSLTLPVKGVMSAAVTPRGLAVGA